MPKSTSRKRATREGLVSNAAKWHFDYWGMRGYKYKGGEPVKEKYMMILTDDSSGIVATKLTNTIDANEVTNWFTAVANARGVPATIVVDNLTHFPSGAFCKAVLALGTKVDHTLLHPIWKGRAERMMRRFVHSGFEWIDSPAYP